MKRLSERDCFIFFGTSKGCSNTDLYNSLCIEKYQLIVWKRKPTKAEEEEVEG
jgi:hypothetical protein